MKAYVPWDIQYRSELKLGPGCIAGEQDRLRIPQERIAARLRLDQKAIYYHLGKKAELPFSLNTELRREFTVPQVAEKHRWLEPLVWSIALEGKDDLLRFKALNPDVACYYAEI